MEIVWDLAIINLVNYQLRCGICNDKNKPHFELESGVTRNAIVEQKRSSEEFQAYLEDLFDKPGPVIKYNWNFASREMRK